ncbi:NB-ARC domain [Seminavis robusta]|uniref:NB-ARC domain n=1 Tax=Seminavis robusta TaxID=568900 RepID=A0A9N8E5Z7_9STRA|nr:NB-ARC domain [Seminavis robusta]|eukprot:Sro534_g161740.1 NB-ARC domain (728) ;mRNA; f:8825-11101
MPHPRYKQVATEDEKNHVAVRSHNKTAMFLVVLVVLPVPFMFCIWTQGLSLESIGWKKQLRTTDDWNLQVQEQEPSPVLTQHALDFVARRRKAYAKEGKHDDWKLRGHGYLLTYQNIVLAATVISSTTVTEQPQENGLTMGRNRIVIWNVHPKRSQSSKLLDQCHWLTIWVRVNGPEILSGLARPIAADSVAGRDCRWDFWVDIQTPGQYEIDAKLLTWNGLAPMHLVGTKPTEHQCPHVEMGTNEPSPQALEKAPQKTSILGFKLYQSVGACCEICRRIPRCLYWATPAKQLPEPDDKNTGCDLYFAKDTPEDGIPTSPLLTQVTQNQNAVIQQRQENGEPTPKPQQLPKAWGASYETKLPQYKYNTTQFLGCGWSFEFAVDFPCLDGNLDDHVYMETRAFTVTEGGTPQTTSQQKKKKNHLPLCGQKHESFVRMRQQTHPPNNNGATKLTGRWVREPWPTPTKCPDPMTMLPPSEGNNKNFPMETIDGSRPHCWHRSDLSELSSQCFESNCQYILPQHRWESTPLKHDTQFNAVWKNYNCHYVEFTDRQLSECFVKNKISKITIKGASVSRMLRRYFEVRMEHLTFYDENLPDARQIRVNTLMWPHAIWHMNETQWLHSINKSSAAIIAPTNDKEEEYILSPFLTSSEREQYMHIDRAVRFGQTIEELLSSRGYKFINAFELSAAFTYDTTTQSDGLHLVGPPMKMIVIKLFHHICSGTVEGTIL